MRFVPLKQQVREIQRKRAMAGSPLAAQADAIVKGLPEKSQTNKMLAEQHMGELAAELPQPNQRAVESIARTRRQVRKAAAISPLARRLALYGGGTAIAGSMLHSALKKTPEQIAFNKAQANALQQRDLQRNLHGLMFEAGLRTDKPNWLGYKEDSNVG